MSKYSIVWDSPSEDSSESMPCGGGDIGLNVWVENGELLFHISRSGTFDENNQFPKVGRVRVQLDPNPFLNSEKFSQELRLEEGNVVIKATKNGLEARIDLWVDVHNPVIYVEIKASQPVCATATYENWRTTDRVMSEKEALSTSYKTMPNQSVISSRGHVSFVGD